MSRAFDFMTSEPWAMRPEALHAMLAMVERQTDIQALATRMGQPLHATRTVEQRGDVAIVPITGPIFRYANLLTEHSGATSTQVLATDIQAALDDPSVKRILLEVNSPGGRTDGIHELGELIYAARGEKQIVAYISGEGASAAYWLASAAGQIIVDKMAMVGSLGVIATVIDTRARDEKRGIRQVEIVSSVSPDKRVDPASDEGRAKIQAVVDELAAVMLTTIARNRGVSVEKATGDFGRGGLLVGASAVRAGLADGLGSLEGIIGGKAPEAPSRSATIHTTAHDRWAAVAARLAGAEIEAEPVRASRHGWDKVIDRLKQQQVE